MAIFTSVNTLLTRADTWVPAISKPVNTATMKNGPQFSDSAPSCRVWGMSTPAVENTADR